MGTASWGCFIPSLKALLVNEIADLALLHVRSEEGSAVAVCHPQQVPTWAPGPQHTESHCLEGSRSMSCLGSVPALLILYSGREIKVSK